MSHKALTEVQIQDKIHSWRQIDHKGHSCMANDCSGLFQFEGFVFLLGIWHTSLITRTYTMLDILPTINGVIYTSCVEDGPHKGTSAARRRQSQITTHIKCDVASRCSAWHISRDWFITWGSCCNLCCDVQKLAGRSSTDTPSVLSCYRSCPSTSKLLQCALKPDCKWPLSCTNRISGRSLWDSR